MKNIILILCLSLIAKYTLAVNGLEQIIVEKYYVSNAADAAQSIGTLPVGSVTYRIYADMLPGYQFKALYGVPLHELKINTTTTFFNNEDRGATTPTYTKTQAANNSVILDSWFSVGAACVGNFGILKSEDNGVSNVVNTDGILQNNDVTAGIPLTVQDGLLAGSPKSVSFVGFDPPITSLDVFDATSLIGNSFSTKNGSIASLTGSVGPTANNRVLIAQITTNGVLSFELNVQLRSPLGTIEQFVAKNPQPGEIVIPSLTFNLPVTLNLTALIEGFYVGLRKMTPTVDPVVNPQLCDTVIAQLCDPTGAHNVIYSVKGTLNLSGEGQFVFPDVVNGQSFYISIIHRNAVNTWSGVAVVMTEETYYDFTTSSSQAFGNNMIQTPDQAGWAFYSGDLDQDGSIDGSDFLALDPSIQNADGGYMIGDLNGDGAVDGSDFLIYDPNSQNGVGASIPL